MLIEDGLNVARHEEVAAVCALSRNRTIRALVRREYSVQKWQQQGRGRKMGNWGPPTQCTRVDIKKRNSKTDQENGDKGKQTKLAGPHFFVIMMIPAFIMKIHNQFLVSLTAPAAVTSIRLRRDLRETFPRPIQVPRRL
jgi:hypothetical protein